jgi:hypothetical protein
MPVKDSHTRIKPLALASGRGRYMAVAPERTLVSVGSVYSRRYTNHRDSSSNRGDRRIGGGELR